MRKLILIAVASMSSGLFVGNSAFACGGGSGSCTAMATAAPATTARATNGARSYSYDPAPTMRAPLMMRGYSSFGGGSRSAGGKMSGNYGR